MLFLLFYVYSSLVVMFPAIRLNKLNPSCLFTTLPCWPVNYFYSFTILLRLQYSRMGLTNHNHIVIKQFWAIKTVKAQSKIAVKLTGELLISVLPPSEIKYIISNNWTATEEIAVTTRRLREQHASGKQILLLSIKNALCPASVQAADVTCLFRWRLLKQQSA